MNYTLKSSVAALALCGLASAAIAEDVKIGILLGFTGPVESLTPQMGASAELAIAEASDSGLFLGGQTISGKRGDSTCIDSSAATASAERLVSSEKIVGLMGAACSGVTMAVLNNVAIPNDLVMISPSATSPALSADTDNGLFFRTAPSDLRQGELLATVLLDRDVKNVAVSYTNNDYGKGFSDSFVAAYEQAGGAVTLVAPHEDGKADYTAEASALSVAGGDLLVLLGYADQGASGIIRASLDIGGFDQFAGGDGMHSEIIIKNFGSDLNFFGIVPWATGDGAERFTAIAEKAAIKADSSFVREAYDSTALLILAMQAHGSTEGYASSVMDVANAPGELIYPGELAKGLQILADGGNIDYVGGSAVELIGNGESAGTFREFESRDGAFETLRLLGADD